jgi:competence protein ComEA
MGKVNLNTADAAELQKLPGIGEVTAAKIIASREAEGPFASTEDLKRVSGIGDKKYAAVADLITV